MEPTLVTVASFTSPLEAYIAKGRLEAEGIPAFIAHEHHIWAKWFLSHALGGVKVQVLKEQQDSAEKVISSLLNGEFEETLYQEFDNIDQNTCPKCHSNNSISRFPKGLVFILILFLVLTNVIFPIRREIHICHDCDHKWRY